MQAGNGTSQSKAMQCDANARWLVAENAHQLVGAATTMTMKTTTALATLSRQQQQGQLGLVPDGGAEVKVDVDSAWAWLNVRRSG